MQHTSSKAKATKHKKSTAKKTARKLSAKKLASRKGPAKSATEYPIGTRRKGLDKNMWIVKESGKSQRWVRVTSNVSAKKKNLQSDENYDEWASAGSMLEMMHDALKRRKTKTPKRKL